MVTLDYINMTKVSILLYWTALAFIPLNAQENGVDREYLKRNINTRILEVDSLQETDSVLWHSTIATNIDDGNPFEVIHDGEKTLKLIFQELSVDLICTTYFDKSGDKIFVEVESTSSDYLLQAFFHNHKVIIKEEEGDFDRLLPRQIPYRLKR